MTINYLSSAQSSPPRQIFAINNHERQLAVSTKQPHFNPLCPVRKSVATTCSFVLSRPDSPPRASFGICSHSCRSKQYNVRSVSPLSIPALKVVRCQAGETRHLGRRPILHHISTKLGLGSNTPNTSTRTQAAFRHCITAISRLRAQARCHGP